MISDNTASLITGTDTREYFREVLENALTNQHVNVCAETLFYLINLLTGFVRTERLFDPTPDGNMIRPLAMLYGEAMQAETPGDRDMALQRLGDISLYISGLFSGSLSRSLVDVDYYIAMGGNAYGQLAESERLSRTSRILRTVFNELARGFAAFVDILAEVGAQTHLNRDSDIMRLYEIWLSSGSSHAYGKLQRLGIQPVAVRRASH